MIREQAARTALRGIQALARQMSLYPTGHPSTGEALEVATTAADTLARREDGEAVITMLGDTIHLGRSILPHASLELSNLLRTLQSRGIESITFNAPVAGADVADLGAFIAGLSGDVPAEATIRLNESPFTRADLETDAAGGVRRSYSRSLDVLRGMAAAIERDEQFDLSGAAGAVEHLVEQTISQPAASLLLSTMKSHDEYTFFHSVNVCILSIAMGRLLGLPKDQMSALAMGALLHDIGKVRVPPSILQYPGRLDAEQWRQIKLHPQEGAASILAAAAPYQEIAATVAFEHHARYDGHGYPPAGRLSRDLHFYSRLVATADTYDAITTRRSYRRAETPNRALFVLLTGAGSIYDPDFARAFIEMVGVYPPGSLLELSDGDVVMVTRANESGGVSDVVLVRPAGEALLDVPVETTIGERTIADQLLPDTVGVEPAALLESVGIIVQMV
ncbi:MAG: HD-GYP domain-containing protein [Actinobacteria bacterium]|nr:HD-GYP domain-containing protein [Actinomycetota bacterium]